MFITVFTRAHHFALSWACRMELSLFNPVSLKSILILPSHERLGLLNSFFPSGFPDSTLHAVLSHCATCPAHHITLNLIIVIFGVEYKSWSMKLAVMQFLYRPVISSLLGPNTFLSTLFLNVFHLCSSLNMRDQVSRPYKKGKISILFICICVFWYKTGRQKIMNRMDADSSRIWIFLNFVVCTALICWSHFQIL